MTAASGSGGDAASARPPLTPQSWRELRSAGMVAGAMAGIGATLLLPGLLTLVSFVLFAGWKGTEVDYGQAVLPVGLLAVSALLFVGAVWLSRRRLRAWGDARRRITRLGVVLAAIGGVLVDLAVFAVSVARELTGVAIALTSLVPVAALLGIVVGALIGRAAWLMLARRQAVRPAML
ncbi:hypothetical protein [Agrococcus carbonis]|uniref:Uncharacterized protein n=1 Tax=Agrococcus carbonis TaxID=684552 RepID=A0A1H1Q2G2_9MICO|nr:hypothetical protein [Agrococcus carbonis]SDS17682.1 hypothetical protein SAMN04489719_1717 [Agrococcus carbonis]